MIRIVYAASWLARRRFYSFSHTLYAENAKWREPALWKGRRILSERYNMLLKHPHALLMAIDGKRVVARVMIGAVGNRGYFALFDAMENEEAVRMLMNEAAAWQRRRGVSMMVGPTAPQALDLGGGVLTEGYEESAAFGDAYNAPYYDQLLVKCGFDIYDEFITYRIRRDRFDEEKYRRAAKWAEKRFGYEVNEQLTDKPRELNKAICEIMGDEADEQSMGNLIACVHPYLVREMCPVVYVNRRPVGYLLTIRGREGRIRIVTMWVHEQWRKKGVTAMLFCAAARGMDRLHVAEVDASWVRKDNKASGLSIENAGGCVKHRYKQYLVHF